MTSLADMKLKQIRWAQGRGLDPDEKGYLPDVESNLFQPLSPASRKSFEDGSGAELVDRPKSAAKMRALHSSSALAVNVFDYWVGRDCKPLQTALELGTSIESIVFEAQYPTGLGGIPPNVDVALTLSDGHTIGIESKFSEWLSPKKPGKNPFKEKYFPDGEGIWTRLGLPHSQALVESIHSGARHFTHLYAAQLLKHSLGMANMFGNRFSLCYIYCDWPGQESEIHRREIDEFDHAVGEELRFKAVSYQELFALLKNVGGVDSGYLGYLQSRYSLSRSPTNE